MRSYVYEEKPEIGPYRIKPLARLLYSAGFEVFISFVIIVNAFCLAILTMPNISDEVRAMRGNSMQ